jgi:hypothetical protein
VNGSYNVTSFFQATVGFGQVPAVSLAGNASLGVTTIGAGGRVFLPGWNFSPTVGLHWAHVILNATGTIGTNTSYGFSSSASHLYTSLGFDWQTGYGLNIGVGYNLSLTSSAGGLPYFNVGWFF